MGAIKELMIEQEDMEIAKQRAGAQLRMKNWYWGKFVTEPLPNTSIEDYELYVEEIHGWHHSEEFKNAQD